MRGEKKFYPTIVFITGGSPPHARGKELTIFQLHLQCGITPACAGKSIKAISMTDTYQDHPRMRGEKAYLLFNSDSSLGSPPHARGKAILRIFSRIANRITPACAGKSSNYISGYPMGKDHPRMRGEKFRPPPHPQSASGSPPHARGKEFILIKFLPSIRITPACAGKSPFLSLSLSCQ